MPNIGDVHLDVSTYHDNPFLPQSIRDEIESLKHLDRDLYNIYSLGKWTKMKGLIYPNYELYDEDPDGGRMVIGLDFGYTHPMGVVQVIMKGNDIYLKELFYEREKITSDLIESLFEVRTKKFIADNSRPEAIRELKNNGFNVKPSKKGADSVKHGIMLVKLYNMKVHKGSVNLQQELQRYKWAEARDGVQKEEPVKQWDDLLDAVRYAVTYLHKGGRIKFITEQ
jgi:phage terminase large subunit